MKVLGVISTTAMFILLAAVVPTLAQEEHQQDGAKPAQHEEQAKPAAKQEQTKPQKQEQQAKPAKQEQAKPREQQQQAKDKQQQDKQQQQAKSSKQEQQQQARAQQNEQKGQQHEQQSNGQAQQSQRQYARNGQKDSAGHEYNESRFGRDHHARFEESGGRYENGRREYSYGGYWFYAGSYPAWFYQQDVYFVMGEDGLWYAVSYSDPSLIFQVNIG